MYDVIKYASREVSGIVFLLTLRASSRVLGGESARRGHQVLRTLITNTAVPLCTAHKHRKMFFLILTHKVAVIKCAKSVTFLFDMSDQSLSHRAGQLLSTGGGERTERERLNGRKNTTAVVSNCHLPTGAAWIERERERERDNE